MVSPAQNTMWYQIHSDGLPIKRTPKNPVEDEEITERRDPPAPPPTPSPIPSLKRRVIDRLPQSEHYPMEYDTLMATEEDPPKMARTKGFYQAIFNAKDKA